MPSQSSRPWGYREINHVPSFSQQSVVKSLEVKCVASGKDSVDRAPLVLPRLCDGFVMLGILIPHFPHLK